MRDLQGPGRLELTPFFDTYLDKAPGVPPAGLRAADVDRADYLFISHAHFDHLYGADIIAKATGATLVGDAASVRLMRANGVPDAQIVATAGGDTVRLRSRGHRPRPALAALQPVRPRLAGQRPRLPRRPRHLGPAAAGPHPGRLRPRLHRVGRGPRLLRRRQPLRLVLRRGPARLPARIPCRVAAGHRQRRLLAGHLRAAAARRGHPRRLRPSRPGRRALPGLTRRLPRRGSRPPRPPRGHLLPLRPSRCRHCSAPPTSPPPKPG